MSPHVPQRAFRWAAGVVLLSVVAWVVFMRTVSPLDFRVFVAGGRAVAHGQDPYPEVGTAAVWSGSAFVYPWLTAWLFAPAAALTAHAAAIGMAAASTAAVAGGVWAVTGARLVPFGCVLFASPTLDGLQMGTLNAALFLGLCLAWRWRDHPALAGLAIAVLITLKVFCWPLVLWLLLTQRRRAAGWAVTATAVLLGAGWLFGPLGPVDYTRMLGRLGAHETSTSSGLQAMLVQWSLPASIAELIGLCAAVALVAATAKRPDHVLFAAATVASLLASPVVWHHYYLLAAAPALLVREGAWLYLLIGWASVPARLSYGLSWQWLTLAADATVLVGIVWLALSRRDSLIVMSRGLRPRWLGMLGGGLLAIAAVLATAGGAPLIRGLAQSFLSVAGSLALVLLIDRRATRPLPVARTRRRDQ